MPFNMEDMYKAQWTALTCNGNITSPVDPHQLLVWTPVISSSPAYTSGDCLGPLTEVKNASRFPGGGGIIREVTIWDATQAQRAAIDIIMFNASVTTAADNAAFQMSDADSLLMTSMLNVPTTAYNTAWPGTPLNSIAQVPDGKTAANPQAMVTPYKCSVTSLWIQLIVRGTPTYTSTSDIVVALDVVMD